MILEKQKSDTGNVRIGEKWLGMHEEKWLAHKFFRYSITNPSNVRH